jgi:hypothetical protein
LADILERFVEVAQIAEACLVDEGAVVNGVVEALGAFIDETAGTAGAG